MIETLYHAATFGITGFLIAVVLTREGQILSWWPRFVRWVIRAKQDPIKWNKIQSFFITVTYGCGKCVAGQLSVWFLVFEGFGSPVDVLATISGAVFIAYFIEQKI